MEWGGSGLRRGRRVAGQGSGLAAEILESRKADLDRADPTEKDCDRLQPDACEGCSIGSAPDGCEAALRRVGVVERVLVVRLGGSEVSERVRIVPERHLSVSLSQGSYRGACSGCWGIGASEHAVERADDRAGLQLRIVTARLGVRVYG